MNRFLGEYAFVEGFISMKLPMGTFLYICTILGSPLAHAYIPPPPAEILSGEIDRFDFNWLAGACTPGAPDDTVCSLWTLTKDTTLNSMTLGTGMDLDLNNYVLTIESGVLDNITLTAPLIKGAGRITSGPGVLTIKSSLRAAQRFEISAIISDSNKKVGLDISSVGMPSTVTLSGSRSNTFTGDVILRKDAGDLVLNKSDGATAVQGNVFVNPGAKLRFDQTRQLSRSSVVTLRGGTLQHNKSGGSSIYNRFDKLVVEDNSTVDFGSSGATRVPSYIDIDDLVISSGKMLSIVNWRDGEDFFLVKKDSKNLEGILSKVKFEGYDPSNYRLKEFDKGYWEISGVPEPATYGAIFGTLGLIVFGWRNRRKGGRRRAAC